MSFEDSSALANKIASYSSQLEQVNSILSTDPENTQFLQIRDDLQKVIALTTDLMQYQHTSNDSPKDHHLHSSTSSNQPTSSTAREAEADFDGDDDDDDDDLDDEDDRPAIPTGIIQVGEVVEVLGGDRPYAGVVTSILNDTEYRVKYFEYETEVTLPISSLTRIPPG
jgi:hypothetical protein